MSQKKIITLPNIGDFDTVNVIEVPIKPGNIINKGETLLILESDKAAMELPSPFSGTIREVFLTIGDNISQGDRITIIESETEQKQEDISPSAGQKENKERETTPAQTDAEKTHDLAHKDEKTEPIHAVPSQKIPGKTEGNGAAHIHASPMVRRFARELGVNLKQVSGSGSKGRILKEDVKAFTRAHLLESLKEDYSNTVIAQRPAIDFSQFGEIDRQPLKPITQSSGKRLHQNWMTIPHVTQFDEADITELETFIKSILDEAKKRSLKLTLMAFLVKAIVAVLQKYPTFNASLSTDGQELIIKRYFHIGIATNTDHGLVVPIIRDANKKTLFDIANEIQTLSAKARANQLTVAEMQGGCFTLSNLGGIGGKQFTPIINMPELAILGVSRANLQARYQDGQWLPRLILPYALSYDHRAIDGVAGAQFTRTLSHILEAYAAYCYEDSGLT